MGTWGYGLLDCDPALDIQELWDEMQQSPKYDHIDATRMAFNRWGEAVKYGDTITNMEILALVALHLNNNLHPSKKLVKIAIDAINRELVPDQVSEWEEPEKRKEVLLALLEQLGGKIKPPKKPTVFKDSALYYRNTKHARSELLKIVDDAKGKPWITYMVVRWMQPGVLGHRRVKIPPFLQTLDRYMKHRTWDKDSKISWQANVERLMMLATYLGMSLKMPRDEIVQLIDRCKIWEDI